MTLVIACTQDLSLQRLQAFLGGLYAMAGIRSVEVLHLDGAEALDLVRAGTLAFALVHDAGAPNGVASTAVYGGERLAAVVALSHSLATEPALRAAHAADECLLRSPRAADPAWQDRFDELLGEAGLRFKSQRELFGSSPSDLLFAAAQGDGVALAPATLQRRIGELGEIVASVALEPAVRMPDTVLAWRSAAPPRELAAVRRVARELRSSPTFA